MNSGEVSSSIDSGNNASNASGDKSDSPPKSLQDKSKTSRDLLQEPLMVLFREKFEVPTVIVDLDRLDRKEIKKDKCLNVLCESENDLRLPPDFARKYFSQPKGKSQYICRNCLNEAADFYQDAVDNLRLGKSVFSRDLPTGNEVVVVDDEEEASSYQQITGDNAKKVHDLMESPVMKDLIKNICKSINFSQQEEEQTQLLDLKLDKLTDECDKLLESQNKVQESLFSEMRNLYGAFRPKMESLEPYDIPYEEMRSLHYKNDENDCIFTGTITEAGPSNLPPHGSFRRTPPKVGDKIYTMKVSVFSEWIPAVICSADEKKVGDRTVHYFDLSLGGTGGYRTDVSGQLVAYFEPLPVRFPIYSRVIAEYTVKSKNTVLKKFFSGMVGEVPSSLNYYRYLVFFDDGRVQYVTHSGMRLVFDVKPNIYEHFAPRVQPFIKCYVQTFPERAMLKVKDLDCVKTEHRGTWVNARVMKIDCSLIQLVFLPDNHSEWLYRGSHRLHPMWVKLNKAPDGAMRNYARRTTAGPYVQYENIDLDVDAEDETPRSRAVARKSSSGRGGVAELQASERRSRDLTGPLMPGEQADGVVVETIPTRRIHPKTYRPHPCSRSCVSWIRTAEEELRGVNPLTLPIYYGFSRKLDSLKNVVYIAPCGKTLMDLDEVLHYLNQTQLMLSIDSFDFDLKLNIFNEYVVPSENVVLKDLSFGVENVPIICVNTLDLEVPKYMDYMTKRRPNDGVNLNLDPDFLVCCDCTDNCENKAKCACWQLTLEGPRLDPYRNKDASDKDLEDVVGYKYRRLHSIVPTGIYECNSRCKCCVKTCLNRVAQHPLKHRLQLFKTKQKGWGTRTLNDIPSGTFICVYVGNIFTESHANEDGRLYGDEYFAELDYIEVVEQMKEGYEEFAVPEPPPDNRQQSKQDNGKKLRKRTTNNSRQRPASDSEEEDDPDEEMDSDYDDSGNFDDSFEGLGKTTPSFRKLFGKDESVYIMDAKHSGNIGRYLNHSCDPNIFVQNVFVDTHDLRFPWVAFFSLKFIRAGTELTWDYRYEVGSVKERKLLCHCGSHICRGRLL